MGQNEWRIVLTVFRLPIRKYPAGRRRRSQTTSQAASSSATAALAGAAVAVAASAAAPSKSVAIDEKRSAQLAIARRSAKIGACVPAGWKHKKFDYYLQREESDVQSQQPTSIPTPLPPAPTAPVASSEPRLSLTINAYKLSVNVSAIKGIKEKIAFLLADSAKSASDPTKKVPNCRLLRNDFGETFSIVRLEDITITLFRSLHLNLAGCRHVTSALLHCADALQIDNIVPLVRAANVDNIHASGRVEGLSDLIDLYSLSKWFDKETDCVKEVRFLPQVFPALLVRSFAKGTVQIFSSGSVIILGTKSGRQLSACRRWVNSVISCCYGAGQLYLTSSGGGGGGGGAVGGRD